MVLAVLLLALALAPGLQTAVVSRELSGTGIPIQTLPLLLPSADEEEAVADPDPEPAVSNPCDACFEYMTALIDQLTDTVISPEIEAHPFPEAEIVEHPDTGVGPRPLGPAFN